MRTTSGPAIRAAAIAYLSRVVQVHAIRSCRPDFATITCATNVGSAVAMPNSYWGKESGDEKASHDRHGHGHGQSEDVKGQAEE